MYESERTKEILGKLNACSKDEYEKKDVLPELMQLQKEMADITFNAEHRESADLRISDVKKHLIDMNARCGHIADAEVWEFSRDCTDFEKLISIEIAGVNGEKKAYRELNSDWKNHIILRNVLLQYKDMKTEFDDIVIASSCITIIEVKASSHSPYIDEKGNYYASGYDENPLYNIKEKIFIKNLVLRNAIGDAYQDIPIQTIVVDASKSQSIENMSTDITLCKIDEVNSYLELIESDSKSLQEYDINTIAKIIKSAQLFEQYPMKMNISKFKSDYARLLSKLETASMNCAVQETEDFAMNEKENTEEPTDSNESEIPMNNDTHPKKHHIGHILWNVGSATAAAVGTVIILKAIKL